MSRGLRLFTILALGFLIICGAGALNVNANSLIDKDVVNQRISSFYSGRFFSLPSSFKLEEGEEGIKAEATEEDVEEAVEEDVEEAVEEGEAVDEEVADNSNESTEDSGDSVENEAEGTAEEGEGIEDTEGALSEGIVSANYNPQEGTITYVNPDTGEDVTVTLEELGISQEWLETLLGLGNDLAVNIRDEGILLVGYGGEDGAKKWEYDPSSHLVAHYEGGKDSERVTMITSEEESSDYIWASPHTEDPGAGPDGHLVVQRFIYDDEGNLSNVQYFTWTAGDRQGQDKARYMYREDTIEGEKITPKYYNDPFPDDWDPVITGKVVKDEYGRFWLQDEKGNMYLLTFRVDGFDADGDGASGAKEANSIDWEALIGKEITVRGHQVMSDSEGGVYYNGEKAEVFEVVDIITAFDKENMSEEEYQEAVANMEAVAEAVDPIHQGLVSETPGQTGELGVINIFNGRIPEPGELTDDQHIPRLMEGLAPFYANNIDPTILDQIMQFAIPELQSAIENIQNPPEEGEQPPVDNEELMAQIWDAFNNEDLEEAERLANEFLQNFVPAAQEEQNPQGLYGQVGTVYWILGQIAEQQGDVNRAAAYYEMVQRNYSEAQAYDPEQDSWWNVAQAAQEAENQLEGVDEAQVDEILQELLEQEQAWIEAAQQQAQEEAENEENTEVTEDNPEVPNTAEEIAEEIERIESSI